MMSPLLLVVTFIISWTIMLFFVLPIGVVTASDDHDPLHDPGAPAVADIPKKFLLAALLALITTGAVAWLSTQSWMSFR